MTTVIVPVTSVVPITIANITAFCDDAGEWWKTDGVEDEDVIGAYQAKGAGSYANSLHNLAVEDTYDLVDTGHAPDWDDTNGWKFNGTDDYLDTGIQINSSPDAWSMFVRFSNFVVGADTTKSICGITDGGQVFSISASSNIGLNDTDQYGYGYSGAGVSREPYTGNGVRAIVGHSGYLNGIIDTNDPKTNWDYFSGGYIFIGCSDVVGDSPALYANIYIQAIAIYNKTLTSTQIAAITDNMEAL